MSIDADLSDARPGWWEWASCNTRDGDLTSTFFPDLDGIRKPGPDATEEERDVYRAAYAEMLLKEERAKAICAECAVKDLCLAAAVARREQSGIWGGENFARKHQAHRARALAAAAA